MFKWLWYSTPPLFKFIVPKPSFVNKPFSAGCKGRDSLFMPVSNPKWALKPVCVGPSEKEQFFSKFS